MAIYDDLVAQVQAAVAKMEAHKSIVGQLTAEQAARAAAEQKVTELTAAMTDMEAKLTALVEQLKPATA